jgi:hypothetical protein
LQTGFAGSAPGAQPETARSIGINSRTPATIVPGPLGLRIAPNAHPTAARAQCQVLPYYPACNPKRRRRLWGYNQAGGRTRPGGSPAAGPKPGPTTAALRNYKQSPHP